LFIFFGKLHGKSWRVCVKICGLCEFSSLGCLIFQMFWAGELVICTRRMLSIFWFDFRQVVSLNARPARRRCRRRSRELRERERVQKRAIDGRCAALNGHISLSRVGESEWGDGRVFIHFQVERALSLSLSLCSHPPGFHSRNSCFWSSALVMLARPGECACVRCLCVRLLGASVCVGGTQVGTILEFHWSFASRSVILRQQTPPSLGA